MRNKQFFRDTATIGNYICSSISNFNVCDEEKYNDVGMEFIDFFKVKDQEVHYVAKKVCAGFLDLNVTLFILKSDYFSGPVVIKRLQEIPVHQTFLLKFHAFKNVQQKDLIGDQSVISYHLPFEESDASCYFNTFIVIDVLESFAENAGMAAMQRVFSTFKNIPIMLDAGFLHYGEREAWLRCEADTDSKLQTLVKYYQMLGFHNASKYLFYDGDAVCMINPNKVLERYVSNTKLLEDIMSNSKVQKATTF